MTLRAERLIIKITNIGYWFIPILSWCAIIVIGCFYNAFGMITSAEWKVLFVSSYISLGLWVLALLSGIWVFFAKKREAKYQRELQTPAVSRAGKASASDNNMDDKDTYTAMCLLKDKYLRTHAHIKKFGKTDLFLLRLSVAVVLFEILFILYLEFLYKVIY